MRLIDADELILYLNSVAGCFDSTREVEDNTIEAIEIAPTVNAVPVVRCKDCKHFMEFEKPLGKWQGLCHYYNAHSVMKNDFCSYGKKEI